MTEMKNTENVEHPKHYNPIKVEDVNGDSAEIEPIALLEALVSYKAMDIKPDAAFDVVMGLKYFLRAGKKNITEGQAEEDMAKMLFYVKRAVEKQSGIEASVVEHNIETVTDCNWYESTATDETANFNTITCKSHIGDIFR